MLKKIITILLGVSFFLLIGVSIVDSVVVLKAGDTVQRFSHVMVEYMI